MSDATDGNGKQEILGREVANPFGGNREVAPRETGALISVEQQRAVAEIQARMMIARANPRDPIRCTDLILQDCTRVGLAEGALYQYVRGGSNVSGPSIRLAETIARRWGNIASGIKELSRQNGYSECVAYAWDLETGYYDERQFQVRHWRDTKKGGYQITDERDIYESVANFGQRRKRAVLLTVIPGDVVEAAVAQCEATLKENADTSPDALKKMIQFFGAYGVTQQMIETRCQCRLEAIRPAQLVQLRKIYASLKDEMSTPEDWFVVPEAAQPGKKLDQFEERHGNAKRPAEERHGNAKRPAEERKPKPDLFFFTDPDGEIHEHADPEAVTISFAEHLDAAAKDRGEDGINGLWESNGRLLSVLREAGHEGFADRLSQQCGELLDQARAEAAKAAQQQAPARSEPERSGGAIHEFAAQAPQADPIRGNDAAGRPIAETVSHAGKAEAQLRSGAVPPTQAGAKPATAPESGGVSRATTDAGQASSTAGRGRTATTDASRSEPAHTGGDLLSAGKRTPPPKAPLGLGVPKRSPIWHEKSFETPKYPNETWAAYGAEMVFKIGEATVPEIERFLKDNEAHLNTMRLKDGDAYWAVSEAAKRRRDELTEARR